MDFLQEARLDRVGCFKFSPVDGAIATDMAEQVPEEIKEQRFHRFMQLQQQISAQRLQQKIGKTLAVIIDEIDENGIVGRSMADAPEIDGLVYLDNPLQSSAQKSAVQIGDIVQAKIYNADEYDLWGEIVTSN